MSSLVLSAAIGGARQLKVSAPHAHAAPPEKVKRIFDLCCDAAGFIDAQQFWTLAVQIDGQMTKEEFKYAHRAPSMQNSRGSRNVLVFLSKDNASRFVFKDFYDWYEFKEALLAEHKKGQHPKREEFLKKERERLKEETKKKDKRKSRLSISMLSNSMLKRVRGTMAGSE